MLDAEKIQRDLRDLWDSLGREHEGGVLRACALTLIVVAKDEEDAEAARKTLGVVMHQHPSRAFVLRMEASDAEADSRVFAECWMPFGGHQQICAEGVEITGSAKDLPEVARVLSPLRASDLPCVVWLRGGQGFGGESFSRVLDLADKVVVDTTSADPAIAIDHLRSMHKQGRRVADLAWTRLTCWRETLSHMVEDGLLIPRRSGACDCLMEARARIRASNIFPSGFAPPYPAPKSPLRRRAAIPVFDGSCSKAREWMHRSRSATGRRSKFEWGSAWITPRCRASPKTP